MKRSLPCGTRQLSHLFVLTVVLLCGVRTASAATNKKPILISQATSTRALAVEAVTLRAEPFSLTNSWNYAADNRTRVCIFAMDLELLPGEGANAFSSDVQDGNGKIYPLRVEFVGQVPNFPGITMIVVRLADDLGDVATCCCDSTFTAWRAIACASRLDIPAVDHQTMRARSLLPLRRFHPAPIRR